MARYYHHETVRVGGDEDDIRNGNRKGLDITKSPNYKPGGSRPPPSRSKSHIAQKNGTGSWKGPSTSIVPLLPPSKRQSASPTKARMNEVTLSRVHRRIIVEDHGKPITKASSRVALLQAPEGLH